MSSPIFWKDLPQPKSNWLTGNMSEFQDENKHLILEQWAAESGECFKIRLVNQWFIVSTNEKMNAEILKLRPRFFRRFHKIDQVVGEMGLTGVFTAEGEPWRKQRRLTVQALNMKSVKSYFPVLEKITQRLMDRWAKQDPQKPIDLQKEMMRFTIDITTIIAFGHDSNTLEDTDDVIQQYLQHIFPMINERITSPLPFWKIYKQGKDRQLDKAVKELKIYIDGLIRKTKHLMEHEPERCEHPQNFLENLIAQQMVKAEMTEEEVFGNVFTMLLAGEDTTSNTISWTIFELLKSPDDLQKLVHEIDQTLGKETQPVSMEQIDQMPYLNAVIQESLRVMPVTPNLYMEALEEVTVEGLTIPKGMTVMMQNKVANTSDTYFTDAKAFRPVRWLGTCPYHSTHDPSVIKTFGAGARFCPGKQLAIYEIGMALVAILKNFEIGLAVPAEAVTERFAFTVFPENLMIYLEKREPISLISQQQSDTVEG
ncbi:cytochrome P450 [Persicobacter psychrovividus]|uniref:Cytochrome P450 n=1 Tax=Persicobacter psychrovividus TaxID=387638 RepID=A0ABM7VHY7_9BACT|nr:cytochrome P450 [Persicobacter psychrovividus]